jgi:hypothetical protein
LDNAKTANDFANELLRAPPTFGRKTSISHALELATKILETNDIEGTRRVIDVSGDGPNNWGGQVDLVRNAIVKIGSPLSVCPS